jgi:hypothetical protein
VRHTKSTKEDAPAPEVKPVAAEQDAALAKEYESLPAGVVVRVPVDADGKEVVESAEMRTTSVTEVNNDTVGATFEAAATPTVVGSADELNNDTSVQSWQSHQPRHNQRGNFGNRTDIDINARRSNVNVDIDINNINIINNYYGSYYRPRTYSVFNTSSFWTYRAPIYTCARVCGGYNYYYYPRPSCTTWTWCRSGGLGYGNGGYGSGYGYGNGYGNGW